MYLRLCRNRAWSEIHTAFFPSMSVEAVKKVYLRVPTESRMHRVATVIRLIAHSHNTSGVPPSTRQRMLSLFSRATNSVEAVISSTPSTGDRNGSTTNDDSPPRYTLRPNRPTAVRDSGSRYPVDRQRFPHFSRACEKHAELRKAPDGDYEPPSRLPTPDLPDRSPSVVSGELSDASSLELFGLEARPVASSSYASSVASSGFSKESELLSAEERLTSP